MKSIIDSLTWIKYLIWHETCVISEMIDAEGFSWIMMSVDWDAEWTKWLVFKTTPALVRQYDSEEDHKHCVLRYMTLNPLDNILYVVTVFDDDDGGIQEEYTPSNLPDDFRPDECKEKMSLVNHSRSLLKINSEILLNHLEINSSSLTDIGYDRLSDTFSQYLTILVGVRSLDFPELLLKTAPDQQDESPFSNTSEKGDESFTIIKFRSRPFIHKIESNIYSCFSGSSIDWNHLQLLIKVE